MDVLNLFNTYDLVTPPPTDFKATDLEKFITPPYSNPTNDPFLLDNYLTSNEEEFTDNPLEDYFSTDYTIKMAEERENTKQNNIINNIINYGRQFIGTKYTWGGKSPKTGMDCSGFLSYIFKKNGINLPSASSLIFKAGKKVSLQDARPGDIICSKGSGLSGRHVQMISKIQNGQIWTLEAKGKKYGIVEEPLKKNPKDIYYVRRIINSPTKVNSNDPLLVDTSLSAPQVYNNKKDFVRNLTNAYKKSLAKFGYNTAYAKVLVAHSALESGWGKAVSGNYNYSGIKATKDQSGKILNTKEYDPSRGYYYIKDKFRNFKSLQDFADFKVKLMFGDRYHIDSYNPKDVKTIIINIMRDGYGTADPYIYANKVKQIYDSIT